MYVFDSFAWIELFKGGKKGEKVRRLLNEGRDRIATTTANYYEVYYRLEQEKGPALRERYLHFIETKAAVIPISIDIASVAAQIRLVEGLSAIDAFTLAAARKLKAKVVTGDKDFEKLKDEVVFI